MSTDASCTVFLLLLLLCSHQLIEAKRSVRFSRSLAPRRSLKAESLKPQGDVKSRYDRFLKRHNGYNQQLDNIFLQLDSDGDGQLGLDEIRDHHRAGNLSHVVAYGLKSFDVDSSKSLSNQEFKYGPLFVNLLERDSRVRDSFYHNAHADATPDPTVMQMFREAVTPSKGYVEPDPFADEQPSLPLTQQNNDQAPQSDDMKFRSSRARMRAGAGQQGWFDDLVQGAKNVASQAVSAIGGSGLGALANMILGPQLQTGSSNRITEGFYGSNNYQPDRPKSRFGVPSAADEVCVLCQFSVQRVQYMMYRKLIHEPIDDVPSGREDDTGNTQLDIGVMPDPLAIMRVITKLQAKTGGRGVARLLTEDSLEEICATDNMPEIYYPFCAAVEQMLPKLAKAVYYGFPADAVCSELEMCGQTSYFNKPGAVHTPDMSKIYNANPSKDSKDKCGMRGGAMDRGAPVSEALCASFRLMHY